MNKTQFIDDVVSLANHPKAVVASILDAAFLAVIPKALINKEQVIYAGFGIFEVKKRAARTGRNPKTGEKLSIPESTIAVWRAGKTLKEAVNQGRALEKELA